MPVVRKGGLLAPSSADRSEGQRNRLAREAFFLIDFIENEFNPEEFTLEEILEEMSVVGSHLSGEFDKNEVKLKKRITRSLNYLLEHDFAEDGGGKCLSSLVGEHRVVSVDERPGLALPRRSAARLKRAA